MDKAAAIKNIREQLANGDIGAALQLLITALEPERRQMRDLSNRAIQAKAQLEKIQRDELQGIISFENSKLSYNQITQQVIALIDEWENPELAAAPAQRRRFTPQMILVAVLMLALVGFIGFKMVRKNGRVQTADACPRFEPKSEFNIMVLPFNNLDKESEPSTLHEQIVRRLDRMKGEFSQKTPTSIRGKNSPIPKIDEEAIRSGQDCAAKLVIWGEFEDLKTGTGGTLVTTNYKYLFPSETFAFTKLSVDNGSTVGSEMDASNIPTRGTFVDTITSLTSITSQGKLTGRLEDQFRLLFGVAVMQSGNAEEAIDILQSAKASDPSAVLLKGMALAESHLKKGDKEAAKRDYDRVLEEHPNYWFALNNRALLYYQSGDYAEALQTVERKLSEEPENPAALTLRGAIRIQTRQLKEAEADLLKANSLNTDPEKTRYIQKKIESLEQEKQAEEQRRQAARTELDNNPRSVAAMIELAETNRNLGDYAAADKVADRIIQRDPDNPKGNAIKAETATLLNNEPAARAATQKLQNLDKDTKKEILEDRPVLKTIIGVQIERQDPGN